MVILHIKKGDESQFLYNTSVTCSVDNVLTDVINIYNLRLKISRICYELEDLAKHGTQLPENMMGLTDEQVEELKLKDEWGEKCIPSGGWHFNRDPIGRRNGHQPTVNMQDVICKSTNEVKAMVSKKKTQNGICLTLKEVYDALDLLRGTVMIVYPMNLPPHDNIRLELENRENLEGTQASKEVIECSSGQMWFSGKEFERGKKLSDYLGKNDKSKIIVKITKAADMEITKKPSIRPTCRGGSKFQSNRQEARRAIVESTRSTLLGPALSQITLKLCYGLYAGGVTVGTAGFLHFATLAMSKLKSMAVGHLYKALTQRHAISEYIKCLHYSLYVRLCASQDGAVGFEHSLSLHGVLSEEDKSQAVLYNRTIPKLFAYAFEAFGNTWIDETMVVPLVPSKLQKSQLHCALFPYICEFVQAYVTEPVPAELQEVVITLGHLIPDFSLTHTFHFTTASVRTWVQTLDWGVYLAINNAARVQGLVVNGFNLLACTGSPSQIVRMPCLSSGFNPQKYYCDRVAVDTDILQAICIRPGDDQAYEPDLPCRFTRSKANALVRGSDYVNSAIHHVLLQYT